MFEMYAHFTICVQ